MAATVAKKGYGITVSIGNGASPEVFTAISEVRSISGMGTKRGLLQVTTMESPNEGEEYIGAMKDGNEVQIRCNLTHAVRAFLDAKVNTGTNLNMKVVYPTTTIPFTDYFAFTPLGYERDGLSPNDPMAYVFTIKVAGAITTTP